MRRSWSLAALVLAGSLLISPAQLHAGSVQTFGEGSAIKIVDRSATFDILVYSNNGTSLSDYTEGSLVIATSGDNYVGSPSIQPYFDPFHVPGNPAPQGFLFPESGTTEWTTISTTDNQRIHGIEFLYGNGWTTGDIYGIPWGSDKAYIIWRTLRAGKVVSSGQIGPNPVLPVGTIIGFHDRKGFDQLQLKCLSPDSGNPDLQALALDNVRVAVIKKHARYR